MRQIVLNASGKLTALCEGLGIENIDRLLLLGEVDDFRILGERMTERVKEIIANKPNQPSTVANALNKVAHELACNGEFRTNRLIADALYAVAEEIERTTY